MSTNPVVILGFGVAATSALTALRDGGYDGPIVVLTDAGPEPCSPVLTSYYAGGRIARDACFPWREVLLDQGAVEVRPGMRVEAVDPANRVVMLARGEAVPYSKLLIATGAHPVAPGFPQVEGYEPLVLRTIADADRLHGALADGKGKRVLVCGTSMVGLKVVEACLDRGAQVTLLGRSAHILRGTAHPLVAGRFEQLLEERGVRLRLAQIVADATCPPGQAGCRVAFDDAACERFDDVVLAQGVQPNTDFLWPSGVDGRIAGAPALEVDRGIVVDRFMRTSAPDVFAAGDVAQAFDLETGRKLVRGLWTNAVSQGRCAGRAMADELAGRAPVRPYPGSIAQNVIHVGDMLFASAGSVDERPDRRIEVREAPGELAVFAYDQVGAHEGPAGFNVLSWQCEQGRPGHDAGFAARIGEYRNTVMNWYLDCRQRGAQPLEHAEHREKGER